LIKPYYQEDGITLYNARCEDVLSELRGVNLIVTSPPYNLGIEYDSYEDVMGWTDYYAWCANWLTQLYGTLSLDGRMCLNHYLSFGNSEERQAPLMEINSICTDVGFKHHGLAIWYDITLTKRTAWGSWLSASAPYINSPFEGILIFYKERWKRLYRGTTQITEKEFMEGCGGVWKIQPERNSAHPAPYPVKLAERCILLLSFEGDIVLDPFVGSGTTLLAAKKWGRKAIGIEISKKYCDIAIDKLRQVEMQFNS